MQSINDGVKPSLGPETERIDPGQVLGARDKSVFAIGRDNANGIGPQVTEIDIVVLVDSDPIADRFVAVAFYATT